MTAVLRIGTRASTLALTQAQLVMNELRRVAPDLPCDLVPVTTAGDRDQATSLTLLGGQGVFVKELHEALLAGQIDLAVHSAKDLPTQLPAGVQLVAVLGRGDVRDALVTRSRSSLFDLPPQARIGTSSRRRRALVAAVRPDLDVIDIRGNVDTRLRKLHDGLVDALILAAAGLERLGQSGVIAEYLDPDIFVPAPGQGALALVCRTGDLLVSLYRQVDDPVVHLAVAVERAVLAAFGSGCTLPLGAYATVEGESVTVRVAVAADERSPVLRHRETWPRSEALDRAARLGERLRRELSGGGALVRPTLPLAGRRLLVLRPAGQERDLVERLRALGGDPLVAPAIAIVPPDDWEPLDRALAAIDRFDWVVFTSVNGVRTVVDRFRVLGRTPDELRKVRIAAIGPATAQALMAVGVSPDLVPTQYVAESVAEALRSRLISGQRVLLPRAAEARDVLPRSLEEAGAEVLVVPAYRTRDLPMPPAVRNDLLRGRIDWILLTASSTVRSVLAALGDVHHLPRSVRIAAIGPITAAAARAQGLRVDVVAERHTADGLVEAIVRAERSAS
ncbi:MAG: hydroxymethylbilane synthase [Thermomicrobium sp.]|nr:hydroxymethylbilane synthase [Thermomicrobium sp.]MDW7981417.1 hydroxymethylbilane synthase [Thermomicrobium sp.]